MTTGSVEESHERMLKVKRNLERVIQGKPESIAALTIALIAQGSVLMEDVPGVGKTTLAKALARSLNLVFSRIQFTPDLLPADILGSSIYSPVNGSFSFRQGPIFCNVLLADEINRASPRTQSALLEAMNELQVTVEGTRHPLPVPFLVVATQNPIEFHGTYPLPEAQLDRFLILLSLGYPEPEVETEILHAQAITHPLETLEPVVSREEILEMQMVARSIRMEESITRYIVDIVGLSRKDERVKLGISPRGSLMLFRACRAAALLEGRDYVLPDDVQKMAPYVLPHRLVLTPKARYGGVTPLRIITEILARIPVPT